MKPTNSLAQRALGARLPGDRAFGAMVGLSLLVLAPAAGARSVTHTGIVDVGAKMGGYFFLNDADAGLDNTFAYRLHATYNFSSLMGAELAFDASPKEVNQVSLYDLHLDVVFHPYASEWFVPQVGFGPTFATMVPEGGETDSDPGANVFGTIKLYPWDRVGFRVECRYIARFGTGDGEETAHDLIASAGMFVTFGGGREEVEVLLDTDGDGFLDNVDKCVNTPGVASAEGCPDRDADTVADKSDKCPDDPGTPELEGCNDTDGDTLIDPDDRCPKVAGAVEHKGCKDTDVDTVADPDDRCPRIPGQPSFQGCPPPPPAEVIERYSGAMAGITFELDSDVIIDTSFPLLDEAVAVLGEYPHLRIMIEGHTSSEGTREHNMSLSKRRARSVATYLTDKGVPADRIETEGFGPDRPVASNDTEEDRAKNRRIEFKILRK